MKAAVCNLLSISIKVIYFFTEDIVYEIDFPIDNISQWLHHVAQEHHFHIDSLNFILCSDVYLLDINNTYLNHNHYTDIITFDNSDVPHTLEGDIFISIDRVRENALYFNNSFHLELFRVFVHGLLHLLGFDDKSPSSQTLMREMENKYLLLYFQSFNQ